MKKVQRETSGITLVALVVTISILVILSLITINIAFGKNGIINSTERTKIDHVHHSVWEAMDMEYSAFCIDRSKKKVGFIEYLQEKQIIGLEKIDAGYVINTENLLGKKASLGNGTDGRNDVYKLEEITEETAKTTKLASVVGKIKLADEDETQYRVKYYGESGNRELGKLGEQETPELADLEGNEPMLKSFSVDEPEDYEYDKTEHKWEPVVKDGKTNEILKKDRDYKVNYNTKDFIDAEFITVTITGIGDYEGKVKKYYSIYPAELTIYANNATKVQGADDPEFTATIVGLKGDDEVSLKFSRSEGEKIRRLQDLR